MNVTSCVFSKQQKFCCLQTYFFLHLSLVALISARVFSAPFLVLFNPAPALLAAEPGKLSIDTYVNSFANVLAKSTRIRMIKDVKNKSVVIGTIPIDPLWECVSDLSIIVLYSLLKILKNTPQIELLEYYSK